MKYSDRRFQQRRAVIARATMYFRSGGRSIAVLLRSLLRTSPDMTEQQIAAAVNSVARVEATPPGSERGD